MQDFYSIGRTRLLNSLSSIPDCVIVILYDRPISRAVAIFIRKLLSLHARRQENRPGSE